MTVVRYKPDITARWCCSFSQGSDTSLCDTDQVPGGNINLTKQYFGVALSLFSGKDDRDRADDVHRRSVHNT